MKYKALRDKNGCQIVHDQESLNSIYITVNYYAKMAEVDIPTVNEKASTEVSKGVVDLGINGIKGIEGRYLIPIDLVFIWLMVDSAEKAVVIATKAIDESIRSRFYDLKVYGSLASWNVNE